ncbi:MAG: 2-oxoacid:acceptor oxidoreductase family protein [Oscillospiraceae bacterium]|nr:2-oxoacid:acceptor oxidoreductase family protein [Oscillospiraceae bacterium]MBR3849492.1 2-oxoacid:acceptor oxidoreductase family protein [Oscillospiraceae bacterium]
MKTQELRLAGSGGQGVILASVILADAAVIAGKNAAQSQSYGPEARGGSCKAECIISEESIGFTKVQNPTFLMALTQKSLDQYTVGLPKDCIVLADSSLTLPESIRENTVHTLPILKTAKETVGKAFTANIVAVGAINKLLSLVSDEDLSEAVMLHIPRGTEEINLKALDAGKALV